MAHYRKIPCLPSISVIRYRNDAWTNQFGDHFRASGGLCMMHDGLTAVRTTLCLPRKVTRQFWTRHSSLMKRGSGFSASVKRLRGTSAGIVMQGFQQSWSHCTSRLLMSSRMCGTILLQVRKVLVQWPWSIESRWNKDEGRQSWKRKSPYLKQSSKQQLPIQWDQVTEVRKEANQMTVSQWIQRESWTEK